MEPAASNETAKQEHGGDGADPEEPIEEHEFQRCSRKGRRDACPDIHCKCGDSKQSGECMFHKEATQADSKKESGEEKAWNFSENIAFARTHLVLYQRYLFLARLAPTWCLNAE